MTPDQVRTDLEELREIVRVCTSSSAVQRVRADVLIDRLLAEIGKPSIQLNAALVRTIVQTGVADDELALIEQSIRHRREAIGASRLSELNPGDEFYVSENVRPKLLAGARVRVRSFEGDSVKGTLLEYRSDKWRADCPITLPKALIGETAKKASQ